MDIRPRLTRPHSPVLRRPDGSLQLGVGPAALHLRGVTADEARWLTTLDGSRDLGRALDEAAVHGVPRTRAAELVDALVAAGHLRLHTPAGGLRGRVVISGRGALPALLADILAHSGVDQVRRMSAGGEVVRGTDLVVLACPSPPAIGEGLAWSRSGSALLPLVGGPTHASVGPVLLPEVGPCLHCMELTRTALDPGWSWLRAQLSRPAVGPAPVVDALAPVRLLAVGLASTLVLDHLAGAADASDWSYDVAVPGPTLERRRWPVHPACPRCGAESLGEVG